MIPKELKAYRQFINWLPVWNEKKQKYDKIPYNYQTGAKIDAHNPANHRSFDEAIATGHPVAFVLTERDPFWCLDLDGASAGAPGIWAPWAIAACQRFPGAYTEVSYSGTGLHVMGCGRPPENHSSTFVVDGQKHEFYSKRRMIALGSGGHGDIWQDFTPHLAAFVPVSANGGAGGDVLLSNVPVPEYTGPTNDQELIAKMLQAQSGRQAFGSAAPTNALWNADGAVLAAFFPSSTGNLFDHNAADQALMNALAFWTGKDTARMVRIFSQSRLADRDKWRDRPYYQIKTANAAYMACKMVYTHQKSPESKEAEERKTRAVEAGELLTVHDQLEYFAGCIYIHKTREVYHLTHGVMSPASFKVIYGGHEFSKGLISKKTTWDAFEAYTNLGAKIISVGSAGFDPNMEPGETYEIDGQSFVNTYYPCPVASMPGDVSLFLEHLAKLVPDERDRCYLLGWMAAVVQNPGAKYRWMPVIQGVEGNGKSMLINIMQRAVGRPYSFVVPAKKIDEKNNGFMSNRLFVGIHEIYVGHKREVVDTLKEWIGDVTISSEDKYVKMGMIDNFVNWFGCTNHKNAIPKSKNDRRYFVLFAPQQDKEDLEAWGMHSQYFNKIWYWLEDCDGYANITHFLKTMAISDEFHPGRKVLNAPVSSMETEVVAESMTELQRKILDAIDDAPQGLIGNIISGRKISDAVGDRYTGNAVRNALKELGWIKHPRLPRGKARFRIFEEEGKRPYLYVRIGSPEHAFDADQVMYSFMAAQNYGIAEGT